MKAVNLIPADQRRGAGGLAGRSGGLVYVVVGALSIVVVLGIVYAFAVKSVAARTGQLAAVTAQTDAVQAQAAALAPYVQVQQLRNRAVTNAVALAEQRFNWPGAMRQLALALPHDVTLTALTGSVGAPAWASPGAAAPASASTTATTSGGANFALSGCASSQAEVATVVASLEHVPGVSSVSLQSAGKRTARTPNAGRTVARRKAEAKSGQCPFVSFSMSLTYAGTYTLPNEHVLTIGGTSERTVASNSASSGGSVRESTMQPAK